MLIIVSFLIGVTRHPRIWDCKELCEIGDWVCDHISCPDLEEAWNGGVRHREQLGGNNMKFSTKAKYRMLTTLIDFLLVRFSLPNPQSNQQPQWKGGTGPGPQMRPEGPGACNGEPRVAGIPATQFNVGT